jgi:hypothetical protein
VLTLCSLASGNRESFVPAQQYGRDRNATSCITS